MCICNDHGKNQAKCIIGRLLCLPINNAVLATVCSRYVHTSYCIMVECMTIKLHELCSSEMYRRNGGCCLLFISAALLSMIPQHFEKDDDSNGHIDFITSASVSPGL